MTTLFNPEFARLVRLWARADNVVVLTGAGISTDSGIQDFRGPNGLWTTDPDAMDMLTLGPYMRDPNVRERAWKFREATGMYTAEPNTGHRALTELQRAGKITRIITQNVDGLHQKAGATNVVEVHGTVHEVGCLTCNHRWATEQILARNESDPACERCGGILKHATVAFGQTLDQDTLDAALLAAESADLLIAIGTSLEVWPAAGLARLSRGLAIINASPTPMDDDASAVIRCPISDTLAAAAAALARRVLV